MSALVVDTSAWIDFFAGDDLPALDDALASGAVVVPPIVAAELLSGASHPTQRAAIAGLLEDLVLHDTPLSHWLRVGNLRRELRTRGLSVSTPDAHVAQCALDVGGALLSRDAVFGHVAKITSLRVVSR